MSCRGHFEDAKGNGIALVVPPKNGVALEIQGDGKAHRHVITDELKELEDIKDTEFTIMSPISYFGRKRNGKNARYLYAMVFDLDGVGMPQLRDTLHQMNKDIIPKATFVVNSGTGLHLYYVLTEPIPMYPAQSEDFEGAEICPHPADLEQVHIVHPRAADAGCFAGLPCGGNRHKAG